MGTAFWIRRAATVFATAAALLFVAGLLKGRALTDAAAYSALWSGLATAVFIGGRLYQSSRGQHCALCNDIPQSAGDGE